MLSVSLLRIRLLHFLPFVTSDLGNFFLTGPTFQPSVTLDATFHALYNLNDVDCRRKCAISETCQAYLSFISLATQLQSCHLFQDRNCYLNNSNTVPAQLVTDPQVQNGTLWQKVPGSLVPIRLGECSVVDPTTTQGNTQPTLTTIVTSDSPSTPVMSSSATASTVASTGTTPINTSPSKLSTTASATTSTALPTTPGALRPRTCHEYEIAGYNDTLWTLRILWPWAAINATLINSTYAYCKFGYTAILRNLPYYYVQAKSVYANQQYFFPFPSLLQEGYTVTSTNLSGWTNSISKLNFSLLSALLPSSSRVLLFEGYDKINGVYKSCTYSGLDIGPQGALTVQSYISNPLSSLNAPDGLYPPPINAPFATSTTSFCSSFWKIPANSTNICNQGTNLLLMNEFQKFGTFSYTQVTLAFK